jgi:hypothetical protein
MKVAWSAMAATTLRSTSSCPNPPPSHRGEDMSKPVSRTGEPQLKRGPGPGPASAQWPNKYWIRTTPLPAGARGYDWLQLFNSQLLRPPFSGYHDGNKIDVKCWPDDEPRLTVAIDSAIEYANERLRALEERG